jgi:hypothetical protein
MAAQVVCITGRANRELPLSTLLRQPTDLGGKVSLGAELVGGRASRNDPLGSNPVGFLQLAE